jgi:hypothetical protein
LRSRASASSEAIFFAAYERPAGASAEPHLPPAMPELNLVSGLH